MPENPVHMLDYAPRPRLWRRRPFRLTAIAALLLTLAAAGVYWYPDISFRIRLAYWQRQCMNHVIPPDKVILTDDPKLVPTLLQDPDYVKTTVSLATVPFAAYRPRCYREYRTLALGGKIGGQAVIFMHKLRSQQGIERVVIALDIGDTCMDIRPQDCVEIAIVQRHPLFGKRSAVDGGFTFQSPYSIRNYSGGMANTPLVRFRPGQLDPADPSHFTIRWDATDPWGQKPTHGVFDFRLSPDGTSVSRNDLAADRPTQ